MRSVPAGFIVGEATGTARWLEEERLTEDVMRLAPIMESRQVYEILLPNTERFLIANRQREGSHYDRHAPGEGLLIWHEDPASKVRELDLECADGKWLGAGFPSGATENAVDGGDNLDFWAHDQPYAQDHAGNLGDGTDPSDGVRYRRFAPDTNPDSYGNTREWSIAVESIEFDNAGIATARLHPVPLVDIGLDVFDENGDGVVLVGERAALGFHLSIDPRLSGQFKAVFASDDPLVEIDNPEHEFSAVRSYEAGPFGLPGFLMTSDVDSVCEFPLGMSLFQRDDTDSWGLIWQEDFGIEVVSSRTAYVARSSLVELDGNGDGRAQAGEIVSLSVDESLPLCRKLLLPSR